MPDLTRPGPLTFGQLRLAQLTLDVRLEKASCGLRPAPGPLTPSFAVPQSIAKARSQTPRPLRTPRSTRSDLYTTDRMTQVAKIRG